MKKIKNIWDKVNNDHRHLTEKSSNVQNNINHVRSILSYLRDDLSHIVDWGPGGGYISRFFSENKKVSEIDCVDVTDTAFNIIEKNLTSSFQTIRLHELSENVEDLNLKKNPDLLILFSVIYHFPSIEYFEKISSYWLDIEPKQIIIRNMITYGKTRNVSSYNINNYLRGLVLNRDEMNNRFKSKYNLMNEIEFDTRNKNESSVIQVWDLRKDNNFVFVK